MSAPRWLRCGILPLAVLACGERAATAQSTEQAAAAHRSGSYDEALRAYERLAATGDRVARRGQLDILLETGRYADAESVGRAAVDAGVAEAWLPLGRAHERQGELAEAAAAYRNAALRSGPDSLPAELRLATLDYHGGRRAEAFASLRRFVELHNRRGGRLTPAELVAVGTACRMLGREDPRLFKDAVAAYESAISAAPNDPEPKLRLAELFLDKYNSAEARRLYDEVHAANARHPEALLGLARRAQFDGEPGAAELARRALGVNPRYAEARVFLATLRLDAEDYDDAVAEAERALAIDSTSLEALSVLAAISHQSGDRGAFQRAEARVLRRDPRHSALYATLGELSARNRLYSEAVGFARKAVGVDSTEWRAWAVMGVNQLRTGDVAGARRSLETAFAGDPYHVWTKNSLDLLDTFDEYREIRTPRFLLVVHGKEAALIEPYLAALAEDAYDKLAARYGYKPVTPVRFEVYPSHADFSVRTVGLAGIGALGVSFGNVLAMDSPSARERGAFNWGSTAWHEIAHAFTLGMTDHKVPRWFSEGISVLEERRARHGWGAQVNPTFLAAYKAGQLLPLERINDGFVRPTYPAQVMVSYYHASLVCELIERDWKEKGLVDLLRAYRDGVDTEAAFRRVLGVGLGEFDRRFDRYVKERFATPLAALQVAGAPGGRDSAGPIVSGGDFAGALTTGRELFETGRVDEAVPHLERAKSLFPEYAELDSPYWYLGQIYRRKGDLRRAAAELETLTGMSETHYDANVALAEILEQLGDARGAVAALDRSMYIHPYDVAAHAKLAELADRAGDRRVAVRERRAVLALDPVDRPEALYQLALAYERAGDRDGARREVLRALESAPNFEKAQELLLRLRAAAGAR